MEKHVHLAVVNYLKLAYPKTIFRSDTGAGMKLTIGQAKAQKAIQNGMAFPDLFIVEARGGYFGLFLELKDNGVKIFNKNHEPATPHIKDQMFCLLQLNNRGYAARMAVGFDQARKMIDDYMLLRHL